MQKELTKVTKQIIAGIEITTSSSKWNTCDCWLSHKDYDTTGDKCPVCGAKFQLVSFVSDPALDYPVPLKQADFSMVKPRFIFMNPEKEIKCKE